MKESKFDLTIAIVALVACGGIAFFVTNLLIGKFSPIKDVTFKTVDAISGKVDSPSSDIFNYTAINPTVEVCVGCVGDDDVEDEVEPEDEVEEEE
ncbi:MAG: hypothetical protein MJZ22_00995 [Candidatus Saccharibacteria bacterium]|nr:hypothetical protein [Candidatus Saccharibacteria bacterium]